MANDIFIFDGHAHLSSQYIYPCIVPAGAAAATEARHFKVSDLPATSS